jgi:hypothetical protein
MSSPTMTPTQAIEGMPPIDTTQVEAMRERLSPMLQEIVDSRTEAFRQGRSLAEVPHPFQMPILPPSTNDTPKPKPFG